MLFNKSDSGKTISYQYEWKDKDNQLQSIAFELDKDKVAAIPSSQAIYRPALAQRHVTVSLLQAARNVDPKRAIIDVKQHQDTVSVAIKSRDQQAIDSLNREFTMLKEEALETYLHERFYMRYESPLRERVIKPDHIRYIILSTEALIPLSQAFYETLGGQSEARNYIDLLLGWLQNIPYSTLEDRSTSHGAGYSPPITVLAQNQGDCDSKAVVAAAVTRAFLPNTPMVMVFLRNHALLGIAMGTKTSDDTITYNGVPYVLFDPTGPALLALGEVSESTKVALSSKQYTVEVIPKITEM